MESQVSWISWTLDKHPQHFTLFSYFCQSLAGKSTFRMVYLGGGQDFKHHDFECDTEVAEEIVQKINNILEMRSSPVRKDYIAHRERKLQKRHTLSFS